MVNYRRQRYGHHSKIGSILILRSTLHVWAYHFRRVDWELHPTNISQARSSQSSWFSTDHWYSRLRSHLGYARMPHVLCKLYHRFSQSSNDRPTSLPFIPLVFPLCLLLRWGRCWTLLHRNLKALSIIVSTPLQLKKLSCQMVHPWLHTLGS